LSAFNLNDPAASAKRTIARAAVAFRIADFAVRRFTKHKALFSGHGTFRAVKGL
jgi:hypothetical protein